MALPADRANEAMDIAVKTYKDSGDVLPIILSHLELECRARRPGDDTGRARLWWALSALALPRPALLSLAMLVLLLGAGKGLENGVYNRFGAGAKNSIYVWSGKTALAHKGM